MLKSTNLLFLYFVSIVAFSQNVPFISPLKDNTVFNFSKIDSTNKNVGFMELKVLRAKKGRASIKQSEVLGRDTLSFVFSYFIDSTGFSLSPYFFLNPKEVNSFKALNLHEPKERLVFPPEFEKDTLEDVSFDLKFEYEGQKLADFHIQFTNRTIENGEFLNTPFGRKYCYKVITMKKEAILFREKHFKYVDWYCSQGLVKREVYLNEKLLTTYILKTVQ